jgi:hypothetical protein
MNAVYSKHIEKSLTKCKFFEKSPITSKKLHVHQSLMNVGQKELYKARSMLEKWLISTSCKFFEKGLNTSKTSDAHIYMSITTVQGLKNVSITPVQGLKNVSITPVQGLKNVSLNVWEELITQSRFPIRRRPPNRHSPFRKPKTLCATSPKNGIRYCGPILSRDYDFLAFYSALGRKPPWTFGFFFFFGEVVLHILKDFSKINISVRIRVRIDPPYPLVCRKAITSCVVRPLNGAVLRMRPEKPRSRVAVGVAR